MSHPDFTAPEHANFLGAKAVALATSYLDGRNDGAQLARDADGMQCELIAAISDPQANRILDPTRMLLVAMARTAMAHGEGARQDRWQLVMGALVELVRHESTELRRTKAQRS